jgi:hypothetical protein
MKRTEVKNKQEEQAEQDRRGLRYSLSGVEKMGCASIEIPIIF